MCKKNQEIIDLLDECRDLRKFRDGVDLALSGKSQGRKWHYAARDKLINLLNSRTCARGGDVRNMRMEEFRSAQPCGSGTVAIQVADHKVKKCIGPLQFLVTQEDFDRLTTFVNKARPCITTNPDGHVFCTSTGKTVTSSNVATTMQRQRHTKAKAYKGMLAFMKEDHSLRVHTTYMVPNAAKKAATLLKFPP